MNVDLNAMMLWVAVVWPLLLAIPALHSHLPWSRHLAILPAAVLAVLPGDALLELPWLLFSTGFAIDTDIRWILAMSIVIWLTAATVATTSRRDPAYHHTTTLFLLTLSGNLGAILSTDLVGFFSFSTLMGYSFYGLLIKEGDIAVRRAGRLYLIFLILADLALFEALLIAAADTGDYRYEMVRQAMTENTASLMYLCMVLLGFAFKAAIWPCYQWLLATFGSAALSRTVLLGGVPVAMGLLGAVRWLPIGEQDLFIPGTVIQIMGAAGTLYAALRLFTHTSVKLLPAWVTLVTTGLFIAALGTGLAHPAVWYSYEYLAYPLIASVGLFLTAITFAASRLQDKHPSTDVISQQQQSFYLWAGRWIELIQRWTKQRLLDLQSLWHTSWLQLSKHTQRVLDWETPEVFLVGWSGRIILFVFLGLTLAWLAK